MTRGGGGGPKPGSSAPFPRNKTPDQIPLALLNRFQILGECEAWATAAKGTLEPVEKAMRDANLVKSSKPAPPVVSVKETQQQVAQQQGSGAGATQPQPQQAQQQGKPEKQAFGGR